MDFASDFLVASGGRVYVGVVGPDIVLLGLTVILSGFTPVALSPKYHSPISVKTPWEFNMATFMPTLDVKDRKEPK